MSSNHYAPSEPLKSVFIAYNQAYEHLVMRILSRMTITGYTRWRDVEGRGSHTGEPHLGSHAWPTMNDALITIVPQSKVSDLLTALKQLDEATPEQGLRAFVWAVEQTI